MHQQSSAASASPLLEAEFDEARDIEEVMGKSVVRRVPQDVSSSTFEHTEWMRDSGTHS